MTNGRKREIKTEKTGIGIQSQSIKKSQFQLNELVYNQKKRNGLSFIAHRQDTHVSRNVFLVRFLAIIVNIRFMDRKKTQMGKKYFL